MKLATVAVFLIALALPVSPGASQGVQVGGVGWEGQGADLVVLQLDSGGPDMIVMAYDNPAGANTFRYRVGKNLNASGVATGGWSNTIIVPGVGWEGQGAGMAVTNLDNNPRPELIMSTYDAPSGPNNFRYVVGWNLDASGQATSWTNHPQVDGLGWEGQGAATVVGQIDTNPRPDMILVAFDNPPGFNSFRYRVGLNLDSTGNATWTTIPPYIRPTSASEAQGMGAALVNLDTNARPELVLTIYFRVPSGANRFFYMIGWNLNTVGQATNWTSNPIVVGVGSLPAQGAGLAITCLDSDQRRDWIFMGYDHPAGGNFFRYFVRHNFTPPGLTAVSYCP